MPELFTSDNTQQTLPMPQSGSLKAVSGEMEWQPCGVDGFWIKPLFEDDSTSQRCWLMKVDAGAWSAPHAHDELEQIYVLEGTFYDQESEYNAGDYVIRAPGAMHTAGSRTGALGLLIYTVAG